VQADTLVPDLFDPQSLNRYSYVLNNPLKYVDPSGHILLESPEDPVTPSPEHPDNPAPIDPYPDTESDASPVGGVQPAPVAPDPVVDPETVADVAGEELEKDWKTQLLTNVKGAGPPGIDAFRYITQYNVDIRFSQQSGTGAGWKGGNIYLNSETYSVFTPPDNPWLISLIVHEAKHLEQGFWVALTVYSELEAWQVGLRAYENVGGELTVIHSDILALPLSHNAQVLEQFLHLMKEDQGYDYLVYLLPLNPWPWIALYPPP
jgi:hypothetical protein